MIQRRVIVPVGLIFGLVLSGCVTGEDEPSPPEGGAATESLETLRVGINAAYPPFEFIENGEIVGYDPDIIAVISEELGVDAEVTDGQLSGLIPALQADQFDAIISAITVTEERAAQVLFTQPYAKATLSLLLSDTRTDITTPEGTLQLVVATQAGSSGQTAIENWEEEGHEYAEVLYFQDMTEAYAALMAGRAEAVLDTVPAQLVFASENPGYKIVDGFGPEAFFAIAVKKGNSDLCQRIDSVLTEMKSSGQLEEIQTKWFGQPFANLPDAPPDFATHC